MKRYVSLDEISDGKLYQAGDLVKADCLGCEGCSGCCHGMGESIVLDPYDIWRITAGLDKTVPELMSDGALGLNVVDGLVLPYLKMDGEEKCSFLDQNGRCSIHPYRPGICRMFPLGRYYEEEGFRYFLQVHECDHAKAKIKVSKWLDTPELGRYEAFIYEWHRLLGQAQELTRENPDEEFGKNLNLFLLRTFFMNPYSPAGDFYGQYRERLAAYRRIVPQETKV